MDAEISSDAMLPPPDVREEMVYTRLKSLQIPWKTTKHAPVFTVEESNGLNVHLSGLHTKNLFLKNKKGQLWLVCLRAETRLDLKALAKQLSAQRFSFGAPELLIETLGIAPGAVNPFSAMHDTEGRVTVVLDRALMAAEVVNFHPMRNDRTTSLAPADVVKFLRDTGHEPQIMDMPEAPAGD